MNDILIIAVLIFSMMMLLFIAAYLFYRERQDKIQIMDKIDQYSAHPLPRETNQTNTGFDSKQFFVNLTAKLAPYSRPKNEEEVGHRVKKLIMAGYSKQNASVIFYGLKILLAILLPVVLYLALISSKLVIGNSMMAMMLIVAALLGFYAPEWWIEVAIGRRQLEIRLGFPDALDLMVVCVEAGMGLDQAIKRIADEMQSTHKVISEEFARMNLEMRAGRSRREAMRSFGERTGVEDVKTLVALLVQTDKFGTSIAQALRVLSSSMRTKRRQKAEELAMKLPVKLLFPLILFIFPSLFVVIIGPGAIKIFHSLVETGFGKG